jgi:hypothetical protein
MSFATICSKCGRTGVGKEFCSNCGSKNNPMPSCNWCYNDIYPQQKYCDGCGKTRADALNTSPPPNILTRLIKLCFKTKPKLKNKSSTFEQVVKLLFFFIFF